MAVGWCIGVRDGRPGAGGCPSHLAQGGGGLWCTSSQHHVGGRCVCWYTPAYICMYMMLCSVDMVLACT